MANPQKENGYTAIANEILERLYAAPLIGSEYRVVLCILRKTYGWHKKQDRISLSLLEKETNLSRKQICKVINSLVNYRLLFKIQDNYINSYQFNKDYETWLVTYSTLPSNLQVTKTSELQYTKTSELQVTHKRKKEKKETITKESINKFIQEKNKLISKLTMGG